MSNKFNSVTPERKSVTDTWITPKWIIDGIGPFDLDPCAFLIEGNPIVKTANHFITEEQDGLKQDWFGNVFCNPPYSDLKSWMDKMNKHGNGIVLCFARTETQAWQNNMSNATGINLIHRRIKFLNDKGEEQGNGNAPSALIAYGEENFQRIKKIKGIHCRVEK